ncbi:MULTISPECIES: YqaJ viral recombinase family protein [Polaromonas]|uniref:YqaJ viral recombinase family protein n=1 Tax=Polaromonas aquatica TaxID=332657 RepID=A0ABW1U1G0_9BURK
MSNLKQDKTWTSAPTGLTVTLARRQNGGTAANESHFERGIFSSEAAAIMGLDPTRSMLDIWHEKQGLLTQIQTPSDLHGQSSWQSLLSPLVATVYAKRTGNPIKQVSKTVRHPEFPWMGAAIRWEVQSPEVGLLQCLQVTSLDLPLWQGGAPEHVRFDLMHLLAVTGQRVVDLAVLEEGRSVRIHRIQRDDTLIERLIEAEARFWGYVERGQVPAKGD